jgi:hypothetical protein
VCIVVAVGMVAVVVMVAVLDLTVRTRSRPMLWSRKSTKQSLSQRDSGGKPECLYRAVTEVRTVSLQSSH